MKNVKKTNTSALVMLVGLVLKIAASSVPEYSDIINNISDYMLNLGGAGVFVGIADKKRRGESVFSR